MRWMVTFHFVSNDVFGKLDNSVLNWSWVHDSLTSVAVYHKAASEEKEQTWHCVAKYANIFCHAFKGSSSSSSSSSSASGSSSSSSSTSPAPAPPPPSSSSRTRRDERDRRPENSRNDRRQPDQRSAPVDRRNENRKGERREREKRTPSPDRRHPQKSSRH